MFPAADDMPFRMFFAYGGSFLALFCWEPLCRILGGYDSPAGWRNAMIVVAAFCLLLFLLCFRMTKEKLHTVSKASVGSDLKSLLRNAPWWILIGAAICSNLFSTVRGSVAAYFFNDVIGQNVNLNLGPFSFLFYAGLFLSIGEVSNMVGVALAVPFSEKFGKKSTYMLSFAALILFSALFFYIPICQGGYFWMLILQVVISIFTGVISPLVWSMYADVSDFAENRDGTASTSPNQEGKDLTPLFETSLSHIPAPHVNPDGELQMLVSSIDYSDYVGRIAIGRVERGRMHVGQDLMVCNYNRHNQPYKAKAVSMYTIDSLGHTPVEEIAAGDIVCVSGIENVTIGDTLCSPAQVEPLPFVKISEPTVEMYFSVNDSPFAGREGKYVTSRQLRERLHRELLKDVSLRVHETETTDTFRVAGRGEMHLSILIETLRREGYEFQVGAPRALFKQIDGKTYEPIERMVADVPSECLGSVMEKMGARHGELQHMAPQGDRMRVEFLIPARGLFGYKTEFLTDTRGEGVMSSVFYDYQPYKGEISKRSTGSLIAFETGTAVTYGLFNAQERGTLFIGAGTEVYEGMIIGESPKNEDMAVNVCKKKQLTNTRASGSDDALRLVPPHIMSIEEAMEFIGEDEMIEITPKSIRMRKAILSNTERMKKIKGRK